MAEAIKTRRGESQGNILPATYLYNAGNEYTALTGDWTAYGTGTLTKNAGNLLLAQIAYYQDGRFYTNNAINLTAYTTLKVELVFQYTVNYYYFDFGAGTTQTGARTAGISVSGIDTGQPSSVNRVTLSLDVSALNSSYYVYVRNAGGLEGRGSSNVYKIWLE